MAGRFIPITGIAALAAGLLAAAPASAGNYAVGYGYYGAGYHQAGYSRARYHHGRRHYRRGHYRRHRGGGEAAAIALGVIGGAIILNEIAEDRARDRYYEDRRYSRRVSSYDDRYDEGYEDGYERARAQTGAAEAPAGAEDLDARLDGGPEPIRVSFDSAYTACIQHARNALGNRGFVLSAPYKPETADDTGAAWKITATVTAERGGESWSRAMYCEASESRVFLLELI